MRHVKMGRYGLLTLVTQPWLLISKKETDFKPLLPCGYIHTWKRLMESTQTENPLKESLRNLTLLAVFSWQLLQHQWCQTALAFTIPLDPPAVWS